MDYDAGFPDGNDYRNEDDEDAVSNFAPQQDGNNYHDDDDEEEEDYHIEDDEDDDRAESTSAQQHSQVSTTRKTKKQTKKQHSYDELGAARETRGSTAAQQQWRATKQRFGKFLKWLIKDRNPTDCDGTAERLFQKSAADLEESDFVWDRIKSQNIGIIDIDRFARWLYYHGRNLRNSQKRIAYKTADSNLSALCNQLRDEAMYHEGERLSEAKVKKTRKGMLNLFKRRAIQNGDPMIVPHKTSLESDLLRITMLCLWSNDASMFRVAFFVVALCQFGGRSTETAMATFKRVTMKQPEEFKEGTKLFANMIPHFTIWRIKSRLEQELSVFNNRDIFLLCFPFLMFVSMVTNQNPTEALFPNFFEKAGAVLPQEVMDEEIDRDVENDFLDGIEELSPEERANARNVAKYFKQCLTKLAHYAEELDALSNGEAVNGDGNDKEDDEAFEGDLTEENVVNAQIEAHAFFCRILDAYGVPGFKFQEGLSTHSQKRYAVNEAFQTPHISFTNKCYRMGWISKSLHTVFHYAEQSAAGDRECARVLSRWTTPGLHGKLGGGRPPRLDCLWTGEEVDVKKTVLDFVNCLFENYSWIAGGENVENYNNLRLYLTASFLCRLGDFLSFLSHDPLRRFGTTPEDNFRRHYLLQTVKFAADSAKLTIEQLIQFGKIIEKDFYQRNYEFVPREDLRRTQPTGDEDDDDGGDVGVGGDSSYRGDSRTIGTFMHAMTQHYGNLNNTMLEMKQDFRELKSAALQLVELNSQSTQMLQQLLLLNTQLIQHVAHGHGNPIHEFGLAQLPQMQVAAATAPAEPTRADADGITDGVESPALPLPDSLRDLKVREVFRNWYLKGYNRLISNSSSVRSNVKMTVEYLNLFLDLHFKPRPETRRAQDQWIKEVWEQTDVAWTKAKNFARENGVAKLSERVSSFKKFVCDCDPATLPKGPSGVCNFQPDGNKTLRTWAQLQESRKRKAVEDISDEVSHRGSDAEQAHESTQPSLSGRLAAEQAQYHRVRYDPQYGNGDGITHQNIAARGNERFPVHHETVRERSPPRPTYAGFGVDGVNRGYSIAGRDGPEEMDEM